MRAINADAMKADLLTVDPQYETVIEWCIRVLDAQPTIEPERKKGKWRIADIQNPNDKANGNYLYFCSNCFHADLHAKTQEVPYCWYCGAEMEGE